MVDKSPNLQGPLVDKSAEMQDRRAGGGLGSRCVRQPLQDIPSDRCQNEEDNDHDNDRCVGTSRITFESHDSSFLWLCACVRAQARRSYILHCCRTMHALGPRRPTAHCYADAPLRVVTTQRLHVAREGRMGTQLGLA